MRAFLLGLIALFLAVAGPAFAETRVVIAEGMGSDVDEATRNAARNALLQTVGGLIDADTLAERRKVVRDGLVQQTRQISSKVREYSQGFVERLDILETSREGALLRVSAKVAVRVEDFRRYLSESGVGERIIQPGVLAALESKETQEQDLFALLDERLIEGVAKLRVVRTSVGDVRVLTEPHEWRKNEALLKRFGFGPENAILSIPVRAALSQDFLANLSNVLRKTAERSGSNFADPSRRRLCSTSGADMVRDGGLCVVLGQMVGPKMVRISSANTAIELSTWANLSAGGAYPGWYVTPPMGHSYPARYASYCASRHDFVSGSSRFDGPAWPRIAIRIADSAGTTVAEDELVFQHGGLSGLPYLAKGRWAFIDPYSAEVGRQGDDVALSLGKLMSIYKLERGCFVFLQPSTEFRILAVLPKEQIRQAARISVSYQR